MPRGGLFQYLRHGHFSHAQKSAAIMAPQTKPLSKPRTQPHPHYMWGWGFLFFSNASASTSPFSVVSELRPLPVLATVLVSHGNIPKNAHGLAIPVRRRPWPRDKPLLFFGALAMHVFRAVQIVQQ